MILYRPSPTDPEMVAVCERARAGDAAALAKLPALIADRGWADWLGNLGYQATVRTIERATDDDPVWGQATTQHVARLWQQLSGPDPSAVEVILVRRVVNSWVAVHALELEQAVRPPRDHRQASYLDRRVSQAQRRLTDACRALAAVRRRPMVLQVNAAVNQQVDTAPEPKA
jgi:hypothetical protein